MPVLFGDFVTTEAGTGFVHIAPSHGEEDFDLGRAHDLPVPETVGDDGRFNAWVPLFGGVHVYKADEPVAAALAESGTLLARSTLVHSYPHSWRSKAPLIFRATPQWFIRMDGPERIRETALEAIAATHFVPEAGRTRLASMVGTRPDWCISRQRAWGVPLPVFVDKRSGEPLRDPDVIARVVAAFAAEGSDAWYSTPPSRFLGNERNPDDYEQVMDIVEVWFESGSTHAFVLEERGLPWPADLYLEGSDQHRGWFQTSLLESVGTRGRAPFKAVLTHGFVMDEQGRKMSKSLGNVTAPQEVADKYGADILRLWVMMSDNTEDLRIGPDILKQQAELYRRLRNTLRWLLGSLDGFTEAERVDRAEMPELERWVLHRLTELDDRIRAAVETYEWTGIYPELHTFCATDLSAFYFDIRKDAIYCDRPDSLRRRAARSVLDHLHRCLATWLAPVLCFTAEEAWCARFGEQDSVHLHTFPALPPDWRDAALGAKWAQVREVRRRITTAMEQERAEGWLKSSLQAKVSVPLWSGEEGLLSADEWAEVAIVSAVDLDPEQGRPFVTVTPAPGTKCVRCWRVLSEVGSDPRHPALCLRCTDAVEFGPRLPGGRMTRRRLTWLGIVAAVVVLAADQISKWWILNGLDLPRLGQVRLLPVLDLTMVWNRGVTFGLLNGLGAWSTPAIAVVALLIVAALGFWLRHASTRLAAISIGAIAGGAVGNVMDRLRHGAVVDFIHAHAGTWSWYVFNVADAAIVCGVIALVLESQFARGATDGGNPHAAPCGLPKPPRGG